MELAQAITEALDRLLAEGHVEVRENGAWLAALEGFRYEVRPRGDAVLLHLWSVERSLVRRVVRVNEEGGDRLLLEAGRFGRGRAEQLEFVLSRTRRPAARVAREQFCARFRDLLSQQFPDEKLASLTASADLRRSLSGNYARGVLEAGSRTWAVLGAAPGENATTYDALMTFGLIWLDRAQELARRGTVAGLRLLCPQGAGRVTAYRLQALSDRVAVELYEYSAESWRAKRLDPRDSGNLDTWLVPRREIDGLLAQARTAVDPIRRIVPGAIEAEIIPGTREVALRFRGLLFALWRTDGIYFGVGDARKPLTPDRQPQLEALIHELDTRRSPLASDARHAFYRAQPERWLESLVFADPARVDARLDSRFLYAQVPAFSAGDHSVMDLLGLTRNARLVVLELKASEDINLVSQAVDYWLRVWRHHAQQDFSRYGYFPGVALDPRPPLLFLVAPALHFHPASDVLLRFLDPQIEVCRVGLSEKWRRSLKVVLRQSS